MNKHCVFAEQVIDDPVTGLTIHIRVTPNGESRLHITGPTDPTDLNRDVLFGGYTRDFFFDAEGENTGAGMGTRPSCGPMDGS